MRPVRDPHPARVTPSAGSRGHQVNMKRSLRRVAHHLEWSMHTCSVAKLPRKVAPGHPTKGCVCQRTQNRVSSISRRPKAAVISVCPRTRGIGIPPGGSSAAVRGSVPDEIDGVAAIQGLANDPRHVESLSIQVRVRCAESTELVDVNGRTDQTDDHQCRSGATSCEIADGHATSGLSFIRRVSSALIPQYCACHR